MFCMFCGKQLPDEARFCAYCGKPQNLPQSGESELDALLREAADNPPPALEWPDFPAVSPAAPEWPDFPSVSPAAPADSTAPAASVPTPDGFSEKNGSLISVPGNGLYIRTRQNLCFIPEGESTPCRLTRNRGSQEYYTMDYFNDEIFLWYRENGVFYLTAIDVGSHSRRKIKLNLPPRDVPALHGSRFQIQNGKGYCLLYGNKFMEMDFASGRILIKKLPDIESVPLPEDWKNSGRFNAAGRGNFGNSYQFLYVSGEFGYASFLSSEYTAVRFRLDDPGQFSLVPEDFCCVPYSHGGMISACGPWLVGTGRRADKLRLCQFDGNGVVRTAKSLPLESVQPNAVKGWWRLGSNYVIDDILLNVDTLTWKKLPFRSYAEDFAPAAGGVFLFDGELLYRLPDDFQSVIKKDSLADFVVADIGKFCN